MAKSSGNQKAATPDFRIEKEGNILQISGNINIHTSGSLQDFLQEELLKFKQSPITIRLSAIEHFDSSGVQLLMLTKDELATRGIEVEISTEDPSVRKKLDLFHLKEETALSDSRETGLFEYLGDKFYILWHSFIVEFLFLIADVMYWTIVDIFRRDGQRKGALVQQANNIGVNAISIVGPLSFIIGLVLALQSAAQIRNFGANIFIVDLTVIAMMREMGPLITAIILAGRSGSSIAAEISTMKVTSELDALETMALNPVRFVIVPKMHGGLITVPFLTILADILGILGGMFVAFYYLDISPIVFINRMGTVLENRDIIIGIFKSFVFISIVVLTGSFFGFKVEHGAEGVGLVTTKAVVVSIMLVIIADSIMGLILY